MNIKKCLCELRNCSEEMKIIYTNKLFDNLFPSLNDGSREVEDFTTSQCEAVVTEVGRIYLSFQSANKYKHFIYDFIKYIQYGDYYIGIELYNYNNGKHYYMIIIPINSICHHVTRIQVSSDIYLFKYDRRYYIENKQGKYIGYIGKGISFIKDEFFNSDSFTFSYLLEEQYRGRGIMTRSVKHLMTILPYKQFIIGCYSDNIKSANVALNNGFVEVDTTNDTRCFVYNR